MLMDRRNLREGVSVACHGVNMAEDFFQSKKLIGQSVMPALMDRALLEILDLGGALFGGRLTADAPFLRSDALALAAHERAIDSEYFHY